MKPSILLLAFALSLLNAQAPTPATDGRRSPTLAIRGAMVVDGSGTPAFGPADIFIENNRIVAVDQVSPEAAERMDFSRRRPAAANIDARGRYVLPGFINLHGHLQDSRSGVPIPMDFCLKLWLASGITTVRDVGSDFSKAKALREASNAGTAEAPRLFLYRTFGASRVSDVAARVRQFKDEGADGIKFFGVPKDIFAALGTAAREHNLPLAHHAAIAESNAWEDIRNGTRSIEHWYGIPDAAIRDGIQDFPAEFNHSNELDRFRYAGRLWKQADPELLSKVLDAMIAAGVAWDPTLSIYEAARDLDKAQNQPYFAGYLHPALEKFFQPDLANHGSFFVDWTTEDEVEWKRNYQIWMKALREFGRRGGLIGTGEDAGYIYRIYGFGYLRELELQQEAGFHPLQVVKHATSNGARILGKENELGRIRPGWLADLVIVNGNPLRDFKILYPHAGRIEWTVKDGIPYSAQRLAAEVRAMTEQARKGSK